MQAIKFIISKLNVINTQTSSHSTYFTTFSYVSALEVISISHISVAETVYAFPVPHAMI